MRVRELPETRARRPAGAVLLVLTATLFAGCAVTDNVQQIDRLESVGENPRVLLMPPDIRYYMITAGGVPEPHAEWTKAARANFSAAIEDHARNMGTDLVVMDDGDMSPTEVRYSELHNAVGLTVLSNHFGYHTLPTKKSGSGQRFDWSLGPGVAEIADEYDADYGLFVFYRDEQASGGRVAFAILAAAALSPVSTGGEYGFASLVDLRSGDLVWFNVVGAGSGELRDPAGAHLAVDTLLRDIPTN